MLFRKKSPRDLYAISVAAYRAVFQCRDLDMTTLVLSSSLSASIGTSGGFCRCETAQEAIAFADEQALAKFPIADGWSGHVATVTKGDPDLLNIELL